MAPFLENETKIAQAGVCKFVREGDRIAYDEPNRYHFDIAVNHGIGRIDPQYPTRLVVDDGGFIEVLGERFLFTNSTDSCTVAGDKIEARKETFEVARAILGEERVAE